MKKPISCIAQKIKPSSTLTIDSIYKNMKQQGIDVIGLGAGEPDFQTPEHIKRAGIQAIQNDVTKYTPAAGTVELRAAVCARMTQEFGLAYHPEDIVISSGAKHNLYLILASLVNPGDEVLLPAPYWVSYEEMIRMSGALPVILYTDEADSFKMTVEALRRAITPKTKALILNSPSNPTGMIYSEEEIRAIAEVCLEAGIYVISDDIYCNLIYDGKRCFSIASVSPEMKAQTILVNGVSKSYSMTGWRIGYSASCPELAGIISSYQSHSTGAPSSMAQAAALAALTGPQDCVEFMRQAFEKRRDFLCSKAREIDGITFIKPQGAFYLMLNIGRFVGQKMYGETIRDSDDFARLFLEKGLVATVPCTGFGAPDCIRISFAASDADLENGVKRLETFIKNA